MLKNNDLQKAKTILKNNHYTCVIVRDDLIVFTSKKRGIVPLIEFKTYSDSCGKFSLADKIIGKAAALLCVYLGIDFVYSDVISTPAINILKQHNIDVFYDIEVAVIKNRNGDGLCPMEKLSKGVDKPEIMYNKIIQWLESIKSGN